jgi:signal transduction histidine kinase
VAAGEAAVSTDGEHVEDPARVLIHDLRNLLAVIVNYSELIGEELTDAEAIRADIEEIKTAAERAIVLTEKLPRSGKPGS